MKPQLWKQRVFILTLAALLLPFTLLPSGGSGQVKAKPDEASFQAIKLLIFDEKWKEALEELNNFLKRHPASSLIPQVLFYRARCLSRLPGKTEDALQAYKDFLKESRGPASLEEEAELGVIDMAAELVEAGKRTYAAEIESRLGRRNQVVRYYAAFKLSYFREKELARKSIPILREIIQQEKDPELKDRARIALLRVSPENLRQMEEQSVSRKPLALRILVEKRGKKEPEISLSIPWSLADLALQAIPERDKERLRNQGYDIERIIQDLTKNRGQIIEIRDEDTTIKIWIELK